MCKHAMNRCPSKKDQKTKYVNCKGEHPVSYRGYVVTKEHQRRRDKQPNFRKFKQDSTIIGNNSQNVSKKQFESENNPKSINYKKYKKDTKAQNKDINNNNNNKNYKEEMFSIRKTFFHTPNPREAGGSNQ